jgi:hypothetical protein
MQTEDLENQVSNYSSVLGYQYFPVRTSYRHLTMPIRENGNYGNGDMKGGLLSKQPTFSSSRVSVDHTITSPILLPFLNMPVRTHQNGHSQRPSVDQVDTSPILLPFLNMPVRTHQNGYSQELLSSAGFFSKPQSPASIIETVPPGNWGMSKTGWGLLDQEARRLSVSISTTQQRTTFSDVCHFVGYVVGTTTILSLYMIIPLLILLHATLPSNWNKLMIALGILALAELVICTILIKTIPRGKRKKENVLVQL